jgi:hypothetical protein
VGRDAEAAARTLVVVDATAASFRSWSTSRGRRIVITATDRWRSDSTRSSEFFIKSLTDPEADIDKNDASRLGSIHVGERRRETEHAARPACDRTRAADDNGDGVGAGGRRRE